MKWYSVKLRGVLQYRIKGNEGRARSILHNQDTESNIANGMICLPKKETQRVLGRKEGIVDSEKRLERSLCVCKRSVVFYDAPLYFGVSHFEFERNSMRGTGDACIR